MAATAAHADPSTLLDVARFRDLWTMCVGAAARKSAEEKCLAFGKAVSANFPEKAATTGELISRFRSLGEIDTWESALCALNLILCLQSQDDVAPDLEDEIAQALRFDRYLRRVPDSVACRYLREVTIMRPVDSYFTLLPNEVLMMVHSVAPSEPELATNTCPLRLAWADSAQPNGPVVSHGELIFYTYPKTGSTWSIRASVARTGQLVWQSRPIVVDGYAREWTLGVTTDGHLFLSLSSARMLLCYKPPYRSPITRFPLSVWNATFCVIDNRVIVAGTRDSSFQLVAFSPTGAAPVTLASTPMDSTMAMWLLSLHLLKAPCAGSYCMIATLPCGFVYYYAVVGDVVAQIRVTFPRDTRPTLSSPPYMVGSKIVFLIGNQILIYKPPALSAPAAEYSLPSVALGGPCPLLCKSAEDLLVAVLHDYRDVSIKIITAEDNAPPATHHLLNLLASHSGKLIHPFAVCGTTLILRASGGKSAGEGKCELWYLDATTGELLHKQEGFTDMQFHVREHVIVFSNSM